MSNRYRPSNGTEGEWFIGNWCGNCARDKSILEGISLDECDDDQKCDIIARTFAYDMNHPDYPTEWVRTENGPICTAFVQHGESIPEPRCKNTVDMFTLKTEAENDKDKTGLAARKS